MKLKFALLALALVLPNVLTYAQSATPSANDPSQEQVLKLMDVMNSKQQLSSIMDSMIGQLRTNLSAQLESQLKASDAETQKAAQRALDGMVLDMKSEYNTDELVKELVPIYQKHLTKDEVQSLTDFYSTPAGQALLQKMPVVMQESMEVGSEYAQRHQESLQKKISVRVEEFKKFQESQPKPGSTEEKKQ